MRSGEYNVVSLYVLFCVALSMDLFVLCLTVFENCLVKQFAICLGVFVILLLNVMGLLSAVGGALLDRHVWSSIKCVCCACGPSERRDAPSICLVCGIVCRNLSPQLGV